MKKLAAVAVTAWVCTLVGCASVEPNEEVAAGEDELRSADCPASVEVTLAKPRIMTDAKLKQTWTATFQEWGYDNDAAQEAEQQFTDLTSHLAAARSQGAVSLKGTLGPRCSYKTVDAQTGQPSDFRIWFAQSYGGGAPQLQLRIERTLGDADDTLFFSAPVKTLSKTALKLEPSKDARVNAKHNVPEYHGEPGGPNAWIGYAKVTAKIAP